MKSFISNLRIFLKERKGSFGVLGLALTNALLIYYCLELGNKNPFFNGILYTIINVLTVFVAMSGVFFFVQRWWISSLVVSVPALFLSIANYYTLLYRNSPISTQDIHNAGTALSVMGNYSFPIHFFVIFAVLVFAISVYVTIRLRRLEKKKPLTLKGVIAKNLCLIMFGGAFIYGVYLAEKPIKPRTTFVWSWEDSYYKYGYVASSIEVLQNSLNMVNMPADYSEETLEARANEVIGGNISQNTPDVIFILNETFYDLRDIIDLQGQESAMPFIDSLPESQRGRAVVAGTGGGTNKSEYEFLTSNSIQLMPGITPFNYLDFENANSIVSHLEAQGYDTWGAHPADSLNYSRGIVYPKLGFDSVLFIDEFGETEKYGQRSYATDKFCYEKMLEDYEKMDEGPRFMYFLTIQNHGNWDLNPDAEDIIKISKDFGDYTDDISEFQSCISLSDVAFRELTEYFENHNRKVIICMVGDHAPSFATELLDEIDMEKTFALRSTPYVIWANFDIDADFPKTVSMPFLAPMTMEAAGIAQSPFYRYMNVLKKETPVVTAFNLYKNSQGDVFSYEDENDYKTAVSTYFDMVYNNVSPDANRIQKLFEVER